MGEVSEPEVPAGFTARPPEDTDLGAVFDLICADEEATRGEVDTTVEDIEGDWARPGFDAASQARVVEHDGQVVAYSEQVAARAYVHVHPEHHGRGVGGALLDWTVARARAEGHEQVGQTIADASTAAIGLLRDRGFRIRWETWLMTRDLEPEERVPDPPDGFRLRHLVKADDAEAVHEVIHAAFSGWPDRDPPQPFEDWRSSFFDRDDVVEEHSFVITHDGRTVGALLGLVDRGDGLVEQLGVHPDHQGRGLGEVLLRRSFASFADAGLSRVELATESRTGARDFYERAGLRIRRSFARWTLPLR